MSKRIERFEDLIAWQKARTPTGRIYRTTNEGNFARDYSLKDQIRRPAVSTMSNIAEGLIGCWDCRIPSISSHGKGIVCRVAEPALYCPRCGLHLFRYV